MTFHGRMLQAQHAKREAANRGLSSGNHGMRPLTKAECAAIDPPAGSWGRLLDETRQAWRNLSLRNARNPGRQPLHSILRGRVPAIDHTPAGQQYVLPGAEMAGDAAMARRAADKPLRPRVPQRPCDIGLFSDDAAQADLLDVIGRG
jgi:hypothetical protein